MKADLLIVLALLGAAILMFSLNRPRSDGVALIMMVTLPFTGFSGASMPARRTVTGW